MSRKRSRVAVEEQPTEPVTPVVALNASGVQTPAGGKRARGTKKDARTRMQYRFWLNVEEDGQRWLYDWCEHWSRRRQFAGVIRDSLRLFIDLAAGRTDVLLEVFPWVREALAPAAPSAAVEFTAMLQEIQRLRTALEGQPFAPPVRARGTGAGEPAPVVVGRGAKKSVTELSAAFVQSSAGAFFD